MGRAARDGTIIAFHFVDGVPLSQFNDQSRFPVALDQDSTLVAVIEMSQSQWLVGAIVPGLDHEPQKKLAPDAAALLAEAALKNPPVPVRHGSSASPCR